MKKYLDVKGSGVIDEEGNLKGEVEDFIIDTKKRRVCSYILTAKGVFSSHLLITLGDIKSYGDFIVSNGETYPLRRRIIHRNRDIQAKTYIGKEVIDSGGRTFGSLADIIFDERNGDIKAMICSKGFFEDIFEGRRLIIVNEKTLFEKERIIVEESSIDIINNASFKKLLE